MCIQPTHIHVEYIERETDRSKKNQEHYIFPAEHRHTRTHTLPFQLTGCDKRHAYTLQSFHSAIDIYTAAPTFCFSAEGGRKLHSPIGTCLGPAARGSSCRSTRSHSRWQLSRRRPGLERERERVCVCVSEKQTPYDMYIDRSSERAPRSHGLSSTAARATALSDLPVKLVAVLSTDFTPEIARHLEVDVLAHIEVEDASKVGVGHQHYGVGVDAPIVLDAKQRIREVSARPATATQRNTIVRSSP